MRREAAKWTLGSVFSGIGGIDLGFERAGWEVAWQVENDPSCAKVLEHRFHGVKRYGDIRTVEPGQLAQVDCLAGGFPCQGLSVAGKRLGLRKDPRSALFFEFVRLAEGLRPKWLLIENVPGLLGSHRGADFAVVLHALDQLGYGLAWRILDAQHWGLAQRRRRVFVIGHLGGRCPPSVLFEPEGGGGDPEAGGEAREGTPSRVAASLRSGSRGTDDPDRTSLVFGALRSNPRNNFDPTTEARQLVVAPTLRANYERPGGGPAIALSLNAKQRWDLETETLVARTLQGGGHSGEPEPGSGLITHEDAVRRLTPREWERLQGFPDDWTLVDGMADSPRYRMLGNAVAVPVAEWIARRMKA